MPAASLWRIDLLCQIVDNFGDAGIAWRLARQLSDELGAQVTLWLDQPHLIDTWQRECPAVTVRALDSASEHYIAADVLIAVLTAPVSPAIAQRLRAAGTLWIRYEHLSAEAWVDGCHGLPSPKGDGLTEWYFYPGFTSASGGLLREHDLLTQRDAFQATAQPWVLANELNCAPGSLRISIFGYADKSLGKFVDALLEQRRPVHLMMSRSVFEALGEPVAGATDHTVFVHDWLSQADFDRLLWSCDLNLVRGEESWIRAHWAGKPFIWQPYRQNDDAHRAKLLAFLDRLPCEPQHCAPCAAIRTLSEAITPASEGTVPPNIEYTMAMAVEDYLQQLPAIGQIHRQWTASLAGSSSGIRRLAAFIRDHLQ